MSYWQVLHGMNGAVGPDAVLHVDLLFELIMRY